MATTPAKPAAPAPTPASGFSFGKFLLSVGLGMGITYAYMRRSEIERIANQVRAQLGGGSPSPAPTQTPTQVPAQVPASAPVVTGVTQTIANTRAGATAVRAGDALDVTPAASGAGSNAVEYQTLVTTPTGATQAACGWVPGACRVTLNEPGTYVVRTEARVVGSATAQATSAGDTIVVVAAGAGRVRLSVDVPGRSGFGR